MCATAQENLHGLISSHKYSENDYVSELNRIDGQPMEFEWNMFPGFNTVGIFNKIHQMMEQLKCEAENFNGRIIIVNVRRHCVCKREMMNCVLIIQRYLKNMQKDFFAVIGLSWGLDPKRSGYGTYDGKTRWILESDGRENATEFKDSGHPTFRCTRRENQERRRNFNASREY